MVKNSGAKSAEFIDPEDVDDLCKKTINYGLTWAKRAEPLWKENVENKNKNLKVQEKEIEENDLVKK